MKVSRRMQGLTQFGFKQILVDKDIPPIPSLKVINKNNHE